MFKMVGTRVLQATDQLVEINPHQGRGAATRTALETGLDDGTDAGRIKVAAVLTELLQRDMETWIHTDDLPIDEETLGWNANEMFARFGERMRWVREPGNNLFLVSSEDVITVTWNGTKYIVTVRVAV